MAAKKNKKKAKVVEQLFVQSRVKEIAQEHDFRVGGDFLEQLNQKAGGFIVDAIERAASNGRKTVRGSDV